MTAPHPRPQRALIIGLGNIFRGDDGVGPAVARLLADHSLPDVTITEASGAGADLLELWAGAQQVILIDAVVSGASPGTVHQIDASQQALPASFLTQSTHALGVAQAVELARNLNRLPPQLLFFGIEGQDFSLGAGLSPAVERAIPLVVDTILYTL